MQTFPMFLTMTQRTVIIAGGGEQAAQKARLIARTTAGMVLVAPELDPELAGLVGAGRARHLTDPAEADWAGASLVFVATGDAARDRALHRLAKARGAALVNVVDRPALCDAFTPAIVDRDPVVVAIGTEGTAPVLGRNIRARIETLLEPRLGDLAALAGRLRGAVEAGIPHDRRRAFWDWVFRAVKPTDGIDAAAQQIKTAITAGGPPPPAGRISLIGAGPGAADLLTLRGLRRLQEADVIFYDRLVDPAVLDLARRDAERISVGKEVGGNAWPQDRINGVIVAAARAGKLVVRLKSGDPGVFGRATEEIGAARAAGIAVEIVPGVTAAAGAAASLTRSLTERGETDTLVLTTGRCRPGDPSPDWAAHVSPGTTTCFYMAVGAAPQIRDRLLAAGTPQDLEVDVIVAAQSAEEQHLSGRLGGLPDLVADLGSGAIILLRWPKAVARRSRVAPIAARSQALVQHRHYAT
ncbi:siroheme synthase CysG [Pararhodobacter sp.]|uniref:siroheme synthase CysG n=1 Tax=Pararhodobacter sp. TaxID=2127056 RepID=UPI002FE3CA9C